MVLAGMWTDAAADRRERVALFDDAQRIGEVAAYRLGKVGADIDAGRADHIAGGCAVAVVVGKEQFQAQLAEFAYAFGIGADHHPFLGAGGAGGDHAPAAFHFDYADEAGSVRGKAGIVTESRYLYSLCPGDLQQGRAGRGLYGAAVEVDGDLVHDGLLSPWPGMISTALKRQKSPQIPQRVQFASSIVWSFLGLPLITDTGQRFAQRVQPVQLEFIL